MNTIKSILMERDGMSEADADELIMNANDDLNELLENPQDFDEAEFMADWFGLEPDYFDEFLI